MNLNSIFNLLLFYVLCPIIYAESTTSERNDESNNDSSTERSWFQSRTYLFLGSLAFLSFYYPRGSLVFCRTDRLWRLSPLFVLAENIVIIHRLVSGFKQDGFSFRTLRIYSAALLGLREGNAWQQKEYEDFFSDEASSWYEAVMYDDEWSSGQMTGVNETQILSSTRDGFEKVKPASPRPEGGRYSRIFSSQSIRISLPDWPLARSSIPSATLELEEQPVLARLLDLRFSRNLKQIQEHNRDVGYRLQTWFAILLPHSLNAFSDAGSPAAAAIGAVFILASVLIEILLLCTCSALEGRDRARAIELMRGWAQLERDPQPRGADKDGSRARSKKAGIVVRPRGAFNQMMTLTVSGCIVNYALLSYVTDTKLFSTYGVPGFLWNYLTEVCSRPGLHKCALVIATPVSAALTALFLFLYLCCQIFGAFHAILVSIWTAKRLHSEDENTLRADDEWQFAPLIVALEMAVLIFLAFIDDCRIS